jgi:serine/threonine protein kinase
MDLNPSNILIFQAHPTTPVGIWKITDFSTSTQTSPTGHDLLPPPKLVPLTYSAPEIQTPIEKNRARPESDVWSLGCILFEVLLGWVEGREEVGRWTDGWGNMPCFVEKIGEGGVLSAIVREWLDGKHDDVVVMSCKKLILDVLKLVPGERLTAGELLENLLLVVRKLDGET